MGIFAPTARNFAGSARNSLISWSSSTASSAPATSAKVTLGVSLVASLARDLPNCMTRDPPPCAWLMRNQNRPTSRSTGKKLMKMVQKALSPSTLSLYPSGTFSRSESTSCSARASTYSARTFVAPLTSLSGSLKVWPSLRSRLSTFSVVMTAVSTFLSEMSFSACAVVTVE